MGEITGEMSIEQMVRRVRVDGWCVIDGVIPADTVSTVRAGVLDAVDRYRHTRKNAPSHIGAVSTIINYEQSFAPYLAEPRLLGLAEALLGPGVRISFTSSIVNYPGNERTKWHADWPFNQHNAGHIPSPYPDMVAHLTTLWAISDFDAQSGGTLIVSGSHRSKDNPTSWYEPDGDEPEPVHPEVCVEMKAGSVAVLDSRMWHAGGANRGSEPRVGLAIRYAPWWLNLQVLQPGSADRARMEAIDPRCSENEVPLVRREVYDQLPEQVKPLYQHWLEEPARRRTAAPSAARGAARAAWS